MIYTFKAFDGRAGTGRHPWGAIVAALGRTEAAKLPELHDADNDDPHKKRASFGEWKDGGDEGELLRVAIDGQLFGVVYRK